VTEEKVFIYDQGTLKGEVSLYSWPPVWPVRISWFYKWKQNLSVVIQLIPNQPNRRSTEQWYFPCYDLWGPVSLKHSTTVKSQVS